MKLLSSVVALLLVSLVFASVAGAAGIYAGPKKWYPGQGAGSSYSNTWLANWFATYGSGYDKSVTFIDNQTYAWHNTVRNRSSYTETYPPSPQRTVKGHCVAHSYGFWGSCSIR